MPSTINRVFSLSESESESDIAFRWFVSKFSGLNTLSSNMDKKNSLSLSVKEWVVYPFLVISCTILVHAVVKIQQK